MITCSQCGRENEVFFKFCLGCGAELVSGGEPKTTKVAPRDRTARIASDTLISKAVRAEAPSTANVSESVVPAKTSPVASKPASRRSGVSAAAPPVGGKPAEAIDSKPAVAPAKITSVVVDQTEVAAQPVVAAHPAEAVSPARAKTEAVEAPHQEAPAPAPGVDEPTSIAFHVGTSSAAAKLAEPISTGPSAKAAVQQSAETVSLKDRRDDLRVDHGGSPAVVAEIPSGEPRVCSACNAVVAPGHAFCANCGTRYETKDRRNVSGRVEVRGESSQPTKATLVLIRPDQTDGESFPLYKGVNSLGRSGTDIAFPHDDFLARHHLDILVEDGSLSVIPKRTLNGTFYRIKNDVVLASGNEIRVGQELLRVDLYKADGDTVLGSSGEKTIGGPVPAGTWGRLCVLAGKDRVANAFLLAAPEVHLGRDQGHVTFPHDGYVSGRHAKLTHKDGVASLSDTGSRNGTYVRITAEHDLKSGDLLLAGQQLFRIQFY